MLKKVFAVLLLTPFIQNCAQLGMASAADVKENVEPSYKTILKSDESVFFMCLSKELEQAGRVTSYSLSGENTPGELVAYTPGGILTTLVSNENATLELRVTLMVQNQWDKTVISFIERCA
jgi:hypothetical protein